MTIITAAILIPIATGEIGLRDLLEAFKSPIGWVAVFCGGLVAVLSSKGVGLIASDPQITVALVFGTILGVVFLRGIAAGPVIASGIHLLYLTSVCFRKIANFVCFRSLVIPFTDRAIYDN